LSTGLSVWQRRMSDAELDLDQVKNALIRMRDELSGIDLSNDAAAIVELDQSRVGRLSRMDAMQAQAMSQESNRRREATLAAIAAALTRIESGIFGKCIACGEDINPKRLAVNPTVRRCIECAENNEPR